MDFDRLYGSIGFDSSSLSVSSSAYHVVWGSGRPGRYEVFRLQPRFSQAGPSAPRDRANFTLRSIHSGIWILTKLDRARSRLYRSQILQENMRLKALAEIYTMHSFAQLQNHIFFKKLVEFAKIAKNFRNFARFGNFCKKFGKILTKN